jgi:hypothetical protein
MRTNQNLLFVSLISLSALFTSCKKEKDDQVELPVFGTCEAVSPVGSLVQTGVGGPYTFSTNGGGKITVALDGHFTIRHDDYPNFKIEFWGLSSATNRLCGNHENLNGKHIKDRLTTVRSFLFPDGAKLTMMADGDYANPMLSFSIYDGAESHHINVACKTLEYSSTNASISQQLDNAEPDGETATIEFSSTGAWFVNLYTEDTPGNKVMNRVPLGELIWAQPNTVNDHFDDLRLNHT